MRPGSSSIETEVRSSLHPIHSQAGALTGEVAGEFDSEGRLRLDLPHGGWVEVPVVELRSGSRLSDMEMQRRAEAGRYPVIRFEVTKAWRVNGSDRYRASVDVIAHGRTRRIEEDFTLAIDGERVVLEAQHTFDIRDFGVSPPRIFMLKVEPQVKVRVRLVAEEQRG